MQGSRAVFVTTLLFSVLFARAQQHSGWVASCRDAAGREHTFTLQRDESATGTATGVHLLIDGALYGLPLDPSDSGTSKGVETMDALCELPGGFEVEVTRPTYQEKALSFKCGTQETGPREFMWVEKLVGTSDTVAAAVLVDGKPYKYQSWPASHYPSYLEHIKFWCTTPGITYKKVFPYYSGSNGATDGFVFALDVKCISPSTNLQHDVLIRWSLEAAKIGQFMIHVDGFQVAQLWDKEAAMDQSVIDFVTRVCASPVPFTTKAWERVSTAEVGVEFDCKLPGQDITRSVVFAKERYHPNQRIYLDGIMVAFELNVGASYNRLPAILDLCKTRAYNVSVLH